MFTYWDVEGVACVVITDVAWVVEAWAVVVPEEPNENPAVLVVPKEKPVDAAWVVPKEKLVDGAWVVPSEKVVDGAWVVPNEKPVVGAWVVPNEKPVDGAWVVPKEKLVAAWVVTEEKPVEAWVEPNEKPGVAEAWEVVKLKPVGAEVFTAVLLGCVLAVADVVLKPKLGVEPREKEGVPKLNAGFAAAVEPKTGVLVGNEGETPKVGTLVLVGKEKAGAKKKT